MAVAIVTVAIWSITQMKGQLRWAMALDLLVWGITSMVATVEENRSTWLLLAIIALAGRLAADEPEEVAECFPSAVPNSYNRSVSG